MKSDLTKLGRHRFKILSFKGERVAIDEKIAPLLQDMWKLGINTTNSCQEQCNFHCKHTWVTKKDKRGDYTTVIPTENCYNNIWLCFEQSSDLELFYNLICEWADYSKDPNAMYHKIVDGEWANRFNAYNHGVTGHWKRYTFNKKRCSQMMWNEDACKKNNIILSPQITFPIEHLPYVEERIKLALSKKQKSKRKNKTK